MRLTRNHTCALTIGTAYIYCTYTCPLATIGPIVLHTHILANNELLYLGFPSTLARLANSLKMYDVIAFVAYLWFTFVLSQPLREIWTVVFGVLTGVIWMYPVSHVRAD